MSLRLVHRHRLTTLLVAAAMLAALAVQPVAAAPERDADADGAAQQASSQDTGDGAADDGATDDGAADDGATDDGATGDGATGDGATDEPRTDDTGTDDTGTDDGSTNDGGTADGRADDTGTRDEGDAGDADEGDESTDEDEADASTDDGFATAASPPPGGFPIRSAVRAVGTPMPDVRFAGSGWGHGVGMSQYGAQNMARQGRSAADILSHYYPGTALSERATTRGIRVGLRQRVSSTWVRAIDGDLAWWACTPASDPATRTPDANCTDLRGPAPTPPPADGGNGDGGDGSGSAVQGPAIVQPSGSTYHVCPRPSGVQRVQIGACDQANPTVVASTDRPILRLRHHGTRIEAPGPNATRCNTDERVGIGCYRRGAHDILRISGTDLYDTVQFLSDLEQYLYGLAEMPSSWNAAALQAQAITGRTFALRSMSYRGTCSCDLLATPAHQAYGGHRIEVASGGAWRQAVDATAADGQGRVLTFGGQLAETFYSSSHGGGRSEAVEESWAFGNTPIPYLRSVADPYSMDEPHPFRAWNSRAGNAAFAAYVSSDRPTPLARVERIQILNRTQGGTPREIQVTGVTTGGATDSFVFTHRSADSLALRDKAVAGASFRRNLPTTGHPAAAGGRLPSSQIQRIGFEPFVDDDGTTHEYAITWANRAGIAEGVAADRFAPAADVTRAQMASFLYRTFSIPQPTQRGRFTDVSDPDAAHALAIDALAEAGVAGGYDDGTFRPGQPVTRDQMATFIARAAGLQPASGERRFTDVDPRSTHGPAVTAVAEKGITTGCDAEGTRYCPRDPVSRGQMASFLRRAATS